jgi:signal transduction histidine kinase
MTLRTRLAVLGLAVVTASVLVMAAVTYGTIRLQAREAVDDTLRREADRLAAALPETLDRAAGRDGELDDVELATAIDAVLALNPGSDDHLAAITTAGGTRTTDAGPAALLELEGDGELPAVEPDRLTTVDTDEGPVRVLEVTLATSDGPLGHLSVYAPLADAQDDAREALAVVLAGGLVAIAVGGTAIVVVTRRALRPLHELAEATAGVDADLEDRLPTGPHHDEVGTLSAELNRMLDRLAEDRAQRRVVLGAVSHELRTPLAVARGHLEVFRTLDADPDSPAARTAATLDVELARISRLVDDLTAVARGALDQEVELGPVFVPDALGDLRERVEALDESDVDIGDAPPVVIEADAGRLAQALLNLVRNATAHTPAGTRVTVWAEADDHVVRLVVADDGDGIDPTLTHDVFEPFVTTRPGGTGLGLAVVRALIEAQGGQVALQTSAGGTEVTLAFPRAA